MKKVIFVLMTMSSVLGFGQSSQDQRLITVIGNAFQEVEPDWVSLQMSVKETDKTKKESEIVKMESAILDFLKSLGLEKESFRVDKYSANTIYSYSNSSKFKVNKSYELKITDIRLLDTIVAKCFDVGMDNLNVKEVGHSEIDELQNVVLLSAISNAKEKANLISESLNLNGINVFSVDESYKVVNYGPGRRTFDNFNLEEVVVVGYGTSNRSRVGSSLSLQKIEINKTVIIKYEIL